MSTRQPQPPPLRYGVLLKQWYRVVWSTVRAIFLLVTIKIWIISLIEPRHHWPNAVMWTANSLFCTSVVWYSCHLAIWTLKGLNVFIFLTAHRREGTLSIQKKMLCKYSDAPSLSCINQTRPIRWNWAWVNLYLALLEIRLANLHKFEPACVIC
jgi:hypothetical protein